jgi:hypothetical protein
MIGELLGLEDLVKLDPAVVHENGVSMEEELRH